MHVKKGLYRNPPFPRELQISTFYYNALFTAFLWCFNVQA